MPRKKLLKHERKKFGRKAGTEDDRMTWTGKRIRADGKVEGEGAEAGIGKYMKQAQGQTQIEEDEIVGDWDEPEPEPPSKKVKKGDGFGSFDNW